MKKAKDILIVVLVLLCAVLLYLLLGVRGQESQPVPNATLVKTAQVHGLSLSMPLDDIEPAIERANFTCHKNDHLTETADNKKRTIYYRCKHKTIRNATLNVSVKQGVITHIVRSGYADIGSVQESARHVKELYGQIASTEGLYLNQGGPNVTFQVALPSEKTANMRYQVQFFPDTPQNQEAGIGGALNVGLVQPAADMPR